MNVSAGRANMVIEMGCKRSLTQYLRIGAGGLALSAGILLAGCASPNVQTQRLASGPMLPVVFDCGALRVEAQFDPGSMVLTFDGRSYALVQSVAASGVRFVSQQGQRELLFWNKGVEALLEIDGNPMPTCFTANAGGPLLPFTARGNEPGWVLTLSKDAIVLAYNYGSDRATAPLPQLQTEQDGYLYAAETAAGPLDVALSARVCRDSMTGMPYPWEVVVTLDGRQLRGCGGDPAALLVGTVWTVERVGERAVESEADVTIEFGADGRVQGSTGCNRFGGSFELSGESLTFGPLAATRRACLPPLMQLETEFLDVMQAVQRFDFDDTGALILEDATRRGMRARAVVK